MSLQALENILLLTTVETIKSKKFWVFLKLLEHILKENLNEFENLLTVAFNDPIRLIWWRKGLKI